MSDAAEAIVLTAYFKGSGCLRLIFNYRGRWILRAAFFFLRDDGELKFLGNFLMLRVLCLKVSPPSNVSALHVC